MRIWRFLATRVVQLIPTLLLVSVAVFLLAHLAPGDPVTASVGPQASQELIAAIKAQYHLDQPLAVQYWLWFKGVLQGDLGRSIMTRQPVMTMIGERLGATITLALATTLFYCVIAFPLGVLAARRRGTWLDRGIMFFSSFGVSIPNFYTSMILIVALGVVWKVLPISGWSPITREPLQALGHLAMPVVALGLTYLALLTRMIRSEVLEILGEDYVRTAKAKGLGEFKVLYRHALRNSLLPAITLVGLNFAGLLGGTVLIEEIFSIPGLGRLIIKAVLQRDFPVIQGVTLVVGAFFIISSLLVDLLTTLVDPRISVEGGARRT